MTLLTHEQALDKARELAICFAATSAEREALRRPDDASIQALRESGLLSLMTAKQWGGCEADLRTLSDVVHILSTGCGAMGWISAFYMGHMVDPSRFSPPCQAEIFAHGSQPLITAVLSPVLRVTEVTGGYELSGQISWGSGVMHTDWLHCSGLGPNRTPMSFMVPVKDLQVIDVCRIAGMAGTGSNDIRLDQVFVPAHRALEPYASPKRPLTPLQAMPKVAFALCETMAVFSGMLRGATNTYIERMKGFSQLHTGNKVSASQMGQINLGEAEVRALVAEALMRDLVNDGLSAAQRGMQLADRARLRGKAGALVTHCKESVAFVATSAGASAFFDDCPIQRFWRDITTISTHAFFDHTVGREQVGRHLLDLPPTTPLM